MHYKLFVMVGVGGGGPGLPHRGGFPIVPADQRLISVRAMACCASPKTVERAGEGDDDGGSSKLPIVLVTGVTGYVGSWVVKTLAEMGGFAVRGTVRSRADEAKLREICPGIELVEVDLVDSSDQAWNAALAGCAYVIHVAAKFALDAKSEQEVVLPAVKGTERVMRAAAAAGVSRVVLTSGFKTATPGFYGKHPKFHYTPDDWTDAKDPKLPLMDKAKVQQEQVAWELAQQLGLELVVLLPGGMYGPLLLPRKNEVTGHITALMLGELPVVPPASIPCVDIRDAARAHVLALTAAGAAGSRFLVYNPTGASVTYTQIGEWVHEALPDWPVSHKRAPWLVSKLFGLLNPAIAPHLRPESITFETNGTELTLGLRRADLIYPEVTFKAMARSIAEIGLVENPRKASSTV